MKIWGMIFVGIGVWIWLANWQVVRKINLSRDWPLIIVIIGVVTISKGLTRSRKRGG